MQLGVQTIRYTLNQYLVRSPVVEEGAVSWHQGHRKFLEEPSNFNRLLFPVLSRFGAGKLLHLADCALVPGAERLHRDGQEIDALSAAQLP